MATNCRHDPNLTGRQIRAEYGKPNLPERRRPVQSVGEEAICKKCGCYLIVHETNFRFAEVMTELEDDPALKLEDPCHATTPTTITTAPQKTGIESCPE